MKPNIIYICLIQVEFGAGDTHGPLLGLKIFRNLTSRWWVQRISVVFEQVILIIKPLFMIKPFLKNVCHFFVISCILLSILYTERFLCFSALQQLIVACNFHPVVYGRVSLLCLHATWTKTLWVIYSGDGELSLPWIPASSGTPKAVISPLLCRSVAVLHRHCLIFMPMFCFCFCFFFLNHCS